jgi:hypothetical protein
MARLVDCPNPWANHRGPIEPKLGANLGPKPGPLGPKPWSSGGKDNELNRTIGRGGGDRKDKLLNKACDLYALQLPAPANRNKRNKEQRNKTSTRPVRTVGSVCSVLADRLHALGPVEYLRVRFAQDYFRFARHSAAIPLGVPCSGSIWSLRRIPDYSASAPER